MAEKTALEVFKSDLENLKAKFQALLKDDTDKFVQIAGNYVELNQEKLLTAQRPSLFSAIMKAAQCRLFIDGQEASLVPFSGTVTMMTGYKGILKMVRNSGELASINAGVVYEKDAFEYFVDEKGEHLTHKPAFVKDRGVPVQTYCIARTKGNPEPYIEVMTEEEVDACKKQSAAVKKGYDTPWKGPFADEMRKKTVMRRISKRLPMSTDLNMAINDEPEVVEEPASAAEPKTTSARLENAVGPAAQAQDPRAGASTGARLAKEPSAADEKQKIDDVQQTFSQKIEGVITHITMRENPAAKDKTKTRRYSMKIGEVFYGTFDLAMYQKFEDLYNKKVPVSLTFVTKMNSATPPQPYNDILDIAQIFAQEEVPI